jgi:hypothetical protein
MSEVGGSDRIGFFRSSYGLIHATYTPLTKMDMEEMMERLLAKMDERAADRKADKENLLARMDEMNANAKANQARMEAKLDDNQKKFGGLPRKNECHNPISPVHGPRNHPRSSRKRQSGT